MLPLVLTHPNFDPVAIRIGPLQIHWYALMYLLGFAVGYLLLRVRIRQQPYARVTQPRKWTPDDIDEIIISIIIGVVAGGRLGYCLFYQPMYYLTHPLEILYVWQGGMSFHGGVLGVVIALAIYAWRRKRPFLEVTDLMVPAIAPGLAFGRFGNFINGELWGRPADPSLPWAMIFQTGGPVPRHPSQLYEMLLEGVLLFILLWLYARRERAQGQISAAFLIGYGGLRFLAEFFREPDDFLGLLGFGLSMGQWLSLPMFVLGVIGWVWARRRDVHPPAAAEKAAVTAPAKASEAAAEEAAEADETAPDDGESRPGGDPENLRRSDDSSAGDE